MPIGDAMNVGSIYIDLSVNTATFNSQMAGIRRNMASTTQQFSTNLTGLSRAIHKISAPLMAVSKLYMATFIGASVKALHALTMLHTEEGYAWKRQLTNFRGQLNYEMARIGALLLKTPLFGKTLPQWMNQLIIWLRRLDMSQIQKMVKWFERAAILWGSLKALNITLGTAAGFARLAVVLEKIGKGLPLLGASNVAGAAASGVGPLLAGAAGGFALSGKPTWDKIGSIDMEGFKSMIAASGEASAAAKLLGAINGLTNIVLIAGIAFAALDGIVRGLAPDMDGLFGLIKDMGTVSREVLGAVSYGYNLMTSSLKDIAMGLVGLESNETEKVIGNYQEPLQKAGSEYDMGNGQKGTLPQRTSGQLYSAYLEQQKQLLMGTVRGGQYVATSERVKKAQEISGAEKEALETWRKMLEANIKVANNTERLANAAA